ncbi:MAG: ACT domain-containing protein [Lachnospiraceae bacterium]|nr:ACT domain-containing protein [Lachnospiraceae bacterium]
MDKERYFLVREKAVPEILLKVVEAKRLFDSGKVGTVLEAAESMGISRSSFYKYKDDIFPFHENSRGKTVNVMLQLEDEPGFLSEVLDCIAKLGANILTIHQSIPIGGIASITLGIEMLPQTADIDEILDRIGHKKGVSSIRILGRE